MKNPRFEDDAVAPLRKPDIDQISCKDCVWREKDKADGQIQGATLGKCQVYFIKPYDILWKGVPCPYYVDDKD